MQNRTAPTPRPALSFSLLIREIVLHQDKENPLSRFGSDPRSFFNAVYEDIPPWEIGKPQPAMTALLARYPPPGPILDVGCGSGDLSMYLAGLGYEVLGIDFVEAAIASAQGKVNSLPPERARLVNFQVADALRPSLLQRKFGAIVDSGFFHLFDSEQCDRYVDELALTLVPGGLYYLHAFDMEFPIANMPRQISAAEVRGRFTKENGWHIKEIQSVGFLSRVAPPVPAICACIERVSI
jgi:SAM-dependent methyltransferase